MLKIWCVNSQFTWSLSDVIYKIQVNYIWIHFSSTLLTDYDRMKSIKDTVESLQSQNMMSNDVSFFFMLLKSFFLIICLLSVYLNRTF